jgi:hypothetical protein
VEVVEVGAAFEVGDAAGSGAGVVRQSDFLLSSPPELAIDPNLRSELPGQHTTSPSIRQERTASTTSGKRVVQ